MDNSSNIWSIYALVAAFFAALTTIFTKIGVDRVDANLATAIRTTVVICIAWGIVFAQGNIDRVTEVPLRSILFLIISGVATGCSWLFYTKALQSGTATQVASIDKSSVAIVLLISALFLHEPLTFKTFLGGCLIAIGTIVLVL